MKDRVLGTVHAALLGGWLGAAAVVSFAVAPAAFEALPTRTEAGTFVGHLLRVVYAGAVIAGGVALAMSALRGGRLRAARLALPGFVAAAGAASFGIAARIAALRESLGPMDALALDDPGRRSFGVLHGVSIVVLLAAMLAAAAAIALETYAASVSSSSASG